MKKSIQVYILSAVLVVSLVSLGAAQMMGGNQGRMSQMKGDTSAEPGQMGMMNNMSEHCKTMANDLDKLEKHFDQMMQMDDMKALKSEMKKYQEMMQSMQENMSNQMSMCQNMMSKMNMGDMNMGDMMNSGNMPCKMGMNDSNKTQKADKQSHDH